jgi:hypothetical protein
LDRVVVEIVAPTEETFGSAAAETEGIAGLVEVAVVIAEGVTVEEVTEFTFVDFDA